MLESRKKRQGDLARSARFRSRSGTGIDTKVTAIRQRSRRPHAQPHRPDASQRLSFQTQERWFWRFDRFLQAHPELAGEPVSVMLQHWAAARPGANHAAECERLARALSKAQHHLDPNSKPRRPDPRPAQQVARQWRRPHIYSPEEVRRLLDIARSYPSPRAPLRPISLYTMLVLSWLIAPDCGWENSRA